MKDYKAFFKDKRVTLMGLGLLGRGVGDAEFLALLVKELVITDKKSSEELAPSLKRLEKFTNISYVLGEHKLENFRDVDLVIKAAGVPLDSPYIAEAKKNNIPVRMSAELLAEFFEVPTVGVTGTRGKSTVSGMIYHTVTRAGKSAILGGNVRGVSNLSLLTKVNPDTILVLELDSWQLQGFGEAKISPHIAVFVTFMPDHMNYYKGNMEAYFADKANIFLNQTPDDVFIVGEQVVPFLKEYGYEKEIIAKTIVAGAKKLPKQWKLQIPGDHNRYNAGLAVAAADVLGIDTDVICEAVASFEGVEGRLQFIREVNGVKIYNDNNATTPEATIAGLRALGQDVTLIMGGADKGLDMSVLVSEVKKTCKKVLFLSGTGTEKIKNQFPDAPVFDSLEDAVNAALKSASKSDTILFSPAFASFGMFKNEYERNDQFLSLVQSLK